MVTLVSMDYYGHHEVRARQLQKRETKGAKALAKRVMESQLMPKTQLE